MADVAERRAHLRHSKLSHRAQELGLKQRVRRPWSVVEAYLVRPWVAKDPPT